MQDPIPRWSTKWSREHERSRREDWDKEFVKSAAENAKRLKIAVGKDQDREGKEMIEKLSKLEGSDRDTAYLKWLIGGHEKGMPAFEAEVKNGDVPRLFGIRVPVQQLDRSQVLPFGKGNPAQHAEPRGGRR